MLYVLGRFFESPAQVFVNTVNTVGVMGKGIAKEFKRLYPEMFHRYREYCESGSMSIGKLMLYKTQHKWILNFPTKQHWRQPSKLEYLEQGLKKFKDTYAQKNITSIAFPQLGCGNGELDWNDVRPLMERYLDRLPIDVFVYLYDKHTYPPEHRIPKETEEWLRSEPESLPYSEVWHDLCQIVRSKSSFAYFSNNERFRAEIKDVEHLLLIDHEKQWLVEPEQLKDLWGRFRTQGYCTKSSFPVELNGAIDALMSVFSELNYVTKVEVKDTRESDYEEKQSAIFLEPRIPLRLDRSVEPICDLVEA